MPDPTPSAKTDAVKSDDVPPKAVPAIRVVRSEELFAGERAVVIQHGGEMYRLLVTRNDRLILQK
jgi:hemin uptake protein HemP